VLKYHRGRRRIELAPFYQGLGQVLTYFKHGIDRAALVVGFHTETDQFPDEVAAAEKLLKEHGDQLKASVLRNFPYLHIACVRGENLDGIVILTGSDVDWEEKRLDPHITPSSLTALSLAQPWVMDDCERMWLESVCKVALGLSSRGVKRG
jgi:hypothetical protein